MHGVDEPTALPEKARTTGVLLRVGQRETVEIVSVSARGMVFRVREAPRLNELLCLRLSLPMRDLTVNVVAVGVVPSEDGGVHARCSLFALSGSDLLDWERFVKVESGATSSGTHLLRSSITPPRSSLTSPGSSLTGPRSKPTSPGSSLTGPRSKPTSPGSSLTGPRSSPRSSQDSARPSRRTTVAPGRWTLPPTIERLIGR